MEVTDMNKKNPTDYLKESYRRSYYPEEGGGFYAEIEEFPGCIATGETREEALTNLEKIAVSWIAATLEQGLKIPEHI